MSGLEITQSNRNAAAHPGHPPGTWRELGSELFAKANRHSMRQQLDQDRHVPTMRVPPR